MRLLSEKEQAQHRQIARLKKIRAMAANLSDPLNIPDHDKALVEAIRYCWDLNFDRYSNGSYFKVEGGYEVDYHASASHEWPHRQYAVFFKRNGKSAFFEWHSGMAIFTKPEGAEVLATVCRDYLDTTNMSFELWAEQFGYSTDSRSAEKLYDKILEGSNSLTRLGLRYKEISTLAEFANRF
jgi:hypothetical protein